MDDQELQEKYDELQLRHQELQRKREEEVDQLTRLCQIHVASKKLVQCLSEGVLDFLPPEKKEAVEPCYEELREELKDYEAR